MPEFDTSRNSTGTAIFWGIWFPLAILAVVGYNLISFKVFVLERKTSFYRRSSLVGYTLQGDPFIYLGVIICKLSLMAVFFAWFYMGNDRDRLDRYYQRVMLGGFIGMGLGFALVVIGYFIH